MVAWSAVSFATRPRISHASAAQFGIAAPSHELPAPTWHHSPLTMPDVNSSLSVWAVATAYPPTTPSGWTLNTPTWTIGGLAGGLSGVCAAAEATAATTNDTASSTRMSVPS